MIEKGAIEPFSSRVILAPNEFSSSFNIFPFSAGSYFSKIECFCFVEQKLEPGERVKMPVTFYIDPDIINNIETKGIKTLTLSYTFYKLDDKLQS